MLSARMASSLITSLPEMHAAIWAKEGMRVLSSTTPSEHRRQGRLSLARQLSLPFPPSTYPAEAGEVLRGKHGADDAVVALGVAQSHLILEHPARGGDALGEADHHLGRQTALRAALLAAAPRTGPVAVAAEVPVMGGWMCLKKRKKGSITGSPSAHPFRAAAPPRQASQSVLVPPSSRHAALPSLQSTYRVMSLCRARLRRW